MTHTDLTGKVALITGAARGIGMESAALMAEAGAAVAVADINAAGAEETAAAFREKEYEALGLHGDVSEESSVRDMVKAAAEWKGRLDILVNNAGILDAATIPELTVERWDRMLAVNLRGVQLCSQYAIPHLERDGGGRIVNLASMAGQAGGFLAGVHYTAAKGGIIAVTKAYARYAASRGVNVNCVAPGFMRTEMTKDRADNSADIPLGRMGTALDAAKAVFFLVTGLSDYITGATVDVNGGAYIR